MLGKVFFFIFENGFSTEYGKQIPNKDIKVKKRTLWEKEHRRGYLCDAGVERGLSHKHTSQKERPINSIN